MSRHMSDLEVVAVVLFGVAVMLASWTMFYGHPRNSRRIAERQRAIVYYQLRAGAVAGAGRIWPFMFPFGLACVVLGITYPLVVAGFSLAILGFVGFAAFWAVLIVGAVMFIRPPIRLLPAWYVEEQWRRRAGLPPALPPPRTGVVPTMTKRQRRTWLVVLLGLGLVSLLIRLPYYVTGGVLTGLGWLAIYRTTPSA
jgi:hypothetical protein